jgi:hypothetical protein
MIINLWPIKIESTIKFDTTASVGRVIEYWETSTRTKLHWGGSTGMSLGQPNDKIGWNSAVIHPILKRKVDLKSTHLSLQSWYLTSTFEEFHEVGLLLSSAGSTGKYVIFPQK